MYSKMSPHALKNVLLTVTVTFVIFDSFVTRCLGL